MSNVEVVRRAFETVGRGDPEALIALCDPRFEMHLIGVVDEPVYYQGAEGIREFFRDMALSWTAFALDVEEIEDLDGRVLVAGRQRNRGRASGIDVESPMAFLVEMRTGVPIRLQAFRDLRQARQAAGLSD